MTCDVHEQIGSSMRAFAPNEAKYVPHTMLVDPNTKSVIDEWTGDWSLSQFQKKMDLIEKAMPGPRVTQANWDKYQKALDLILDEKNKEAKAILDSLAKGKNPDKFKAAIEAKLEEIKESTSK